VGLARGCFFLYNGGVMKAKSIKNAVGRNFPHFGVNKQQEAGRLIYEIAKQAWYLGKNREPRDLVKYALAISQNEVKGVFTVDRWKKYKFEPMKWEFEGRVAPDDIRTKYLNRKIPMAFGEGQYNSSRFLNCNPNS